MRGFGVISGACNSGIGFALNSILQGLISIRAAQVDFFFLALSVEMPVFAYIWR